MRVAVVERKLVDEAFFSIYVDNYNAAYEATSHLLDCGCRKLVHITGADEFPHTRIRETHFAPFCKSGESLLMKSFCWKAISRR